MRQETAWMLHTNWGGLHQIRLFGIVTWWHAIILRRMFSPNQIGLIPCHQGQLPQQHWRAVADGGLMLLTWCDDVWFIDDVPVGNFLPCAPSLGMYSCLRIEWQNFKAGVIIMWQSLNSLCSEFLKVSQAYSFESWVNFVSLMGFWYFVVMSSTTVCP
jgi:hypothetical protein